MAFWLAAKREGQSRDWLARSDPRDIAISEIAYGVGFKSTAHFSRKFKRVYGINPRDFREACALGGLNGCEASGTGCGDLRAATLQ